MSNKYKSVNRKLLESTHDFQQAFDSILPQERPLAGPSVSSTFNRDKGMLKCETALQNPEETFNRTIKNNRALASYLGGIIAEDKIPYEKTTKNFYTPQK